MKRYREALLPRLPQRRTATEVRAPRFQRGTSASTVQGAPPSALPFLREAARFQPSEEHLSAGLRATYGTGQDAPQSRSFRSWRLAALRLWRHFKLSSDHR